MGIYSCAITKRIPFRDQQEEISNVYTAKKDSPSQADFASLASVLATWEKANFDPNTTFVSNRVWGPFEYAGDGISEEPNENVSSTRLLADLTGVGQSPAGTPIYRELAVTASWYIGRAPGTGRKRFMRKYWHTTFGQTFSTNESLLGYAFSQTIANNITTKINTLESNINAAGWTLCAPNGDVPTGPVTTKQRLILRQLKQ